MVKKILVVASLLLLISLQAEAADRGIIELKSVSEVEITVENDTGEKEVRRVAAAMANVTPGDTVIFTNYYTNIGEQVAANVVLTNPVPEHMLYVAESAGGTGAEIEFSVDRGRSYGPAEKLMVKDENGRDKQAGPHSGC